MALSKTLKFRGWQFRYDQTTGNMLPDVNVVVDMTIVEDGEILFQKQLKRRITLTAPQVTAIGNILNNQILKPWIEDSPPIFSQG